jgi:uncharacterized protein
MKITNDQDLATVPTSLNLNYRNWKLFEFAHGCYLLNIPTAHIYSIDAETAMSLKTSVKSEAFLRDLEKDLPAPLQKVVEEVDITTIALNVEQSCNLRCVYCYAGDGDYGKDSTMTFAKATAVITALSSGKPNFQIHFFGGEPLLNFALIRDLILWCEEKAETKFRFSVTTNGVLLRGNITDFFKQHRVSVTISYDGKGVQEIQRKAQEGAKQSSDHVREKIKRYREELNLLPSFKIRATIAKEQIGQFKESMADSIEAFDSRVAFAPAFVDKFGNKYSMDETNQLAKQLEELVDGYLAEDDFDSVMKISSMRSFIDVLHRGRVNLNACSAGINYVSVSTTGTYYLCHRFTEDASAIVGDYKTGIDLPRLESIRDHRLGKKEPCNSCWMRNWCGGGCFHDNKVANADELAIDPKFCRLQDAEIRLAMKAYTKILVKRPEILAK